MALMIPGTAGKYLITITRNAVIRIWELDRSLRRARQKYEWQTEGYVLDVAVNADPSNEATFAISQVSGRSGVTFLHGLVSLRPKTISSL